MNNALFRILVGSVASILTTGAYAIPKGPCDKPADVCCDEPKPGPFAFAYPKDVNLACPADFYVNASFLIMQAKEDGLEFAIRDSDAAGLPISHGEVLGISHNDSDYGYNPGVRVGMGFYMNHDAWTIDLDWTWLNITESQSYSTPSGVLIPLWLPPYAQDATGTFSPIGGPDSTWKGISAIWNAHYNTLDAKLGKPYHISRSVIFKPHFGLRAGWIDQHFSVHHGGSFDNPHSSLNGVVAHGQNDFWGIGARAGLDSEWVVGKGWQLFGNIAGSMLFGKFDIEQNLSLNGSGDIHNYGFDLDYDYYQNVPNMELQLGIAWNKYFNKNKYRIGVAAAYEFHEWFDQFNMRKFFGYTYSSTQFQWQNDSVSRGNLTLNGFSVKLQLDI
jgi:hypothetical protein